MKKIIWITSYPKSGNTWMRYLLGNYFFNQDNKFDPDIISYIKKFTLDDKLLNNTKEDFKKNPYSVSKYWLKSQENLKILNGNIIFLKTHNALININGNEFTNENLSLAIIHIVRDPRDVVISFAKFSGISIDETINNLISKKLYFTQDKDVFSDVSVMGSWAFHYDSWKNGISNIPRILIRYEDLVRDCDYSFTKVIEFLSEIIGFKINNKKIESSIELSGFKNLKKFENDYHFKENVGFDKFFRTGKYNNWKKELTNDQIKKIEDSLYAEMIELGYTK